MLVYAYWLPCQSTLHTRIFLAVKKIVQFDCLMISQNNDKNLRVRCIRTIIFFNCCDCNRRHIVIPSHLLIHEIQTNIRRCAIEFVHLTMGNASEREKCNWNWKCMQKMPFLCNKPLFLYASLSCWLFE